MTDARRRRLRPLALVTLTAALAGCTGAGPAHRYFQPTASEIGPYANSFGEAVVPRRGLIVVQGDDLAYGLSRRPSLHEINDADQGQASMTISLALRRALGGAVENRGFPDDTVAQSARRWAGHPPGNLLILSYGYGDLHAHTAPDVFAEGLRRMIREAHAQGATVFVVLSAPISDPLANSALATYRGTAQAVAAQEGAETFDATAAMTRIKVAPWKWVAQRPAVYAAIAGDMAPYIKLVAVPPPAASPQTGQAGSADRRTVRVTPPSAS